MYTIHAIIVFCLTFPVIETLNNKSICIPNGKYSVDSDNYIYKCECTNCELVKFFNKNYKLLEVIRAYDKGPFIYWPKRSKYTQIISYPILSKEVWFLNSHKDGDCLVFSGALEQYEVTKCTDNTYSVFGLGMKDIFNLINGKQIFEMNQYVIPKCETTDSDYEKDYNLICEDNIHKIHINVTIDNKLLIIPLSKPEMENMICFTDSVTFYPIKTNVISRSNSTFIDTQKDGYYWCQCYNYKGYIFATSDKVLWVQDTTSTYTAVLFSYPNLFNIALTNIHRIAEDLKIHKYQHSLKRIYDTGEVLYHIHIRSDEIKIAENVIYARDINKCNISEIKTEYTHVNQHEDYYQVCNYRKCQEYKCERNFNSGSHWIEIPDISKKSDKIQMEYFKEDDFRTNTIDILSKTEVNVVDDVKKALDGILFKRSSKNSVQLAVNEVEKLFGIKNNKTNLKEVLGTFEEILQTATIPTYSQELHYKTENMAVSVIETNEFRHVDAVEVKSSQKIISFLSDGKLTNSAQDADMIVDLSSIMSKDTSQKLSIVVFDKDTLFYELNDLNVNGPIVGISLGNGISKTNYYIDIHIKPTVRYLDLEKSCVFWDFNVGKLGSWSKNGCELLEKQSFIGYDTCRCYHLTYFSQLIESEDRRLSKGHEQALKIITYVGCSLSLFGLFGIGLTGARFKNWRSEFGNKIWMSLSASITLMILTFLLNVSLKKDSQTCVILGIFLHYSVLASFFWMSISAILCYQRLVKVFNTKHSHRLLKASLYGWLLPTIIVGLLLIFDRQNYLRRVKRDSSLHSFCYPNGLGFWLTVFTPIIVVVLSNAVLFSLIVYSLCKGTDINKHGDPKEFKRRATVSFLLFFLFGLTWMFGFLSTYIVFNYLFCITTAFQGFIMFSFFIVLNKNSRNLWLDRMRSSSDNSNQNSRSSIRNRGNVIHTEGIRLYQFNNQRRSGQT